MTLQVLRCRTSQTSDFPAFRRTSRPTDRFAVLQMYSKGQEQQPSPINRILEELDRPFAIGHKAEDAYTQWTLHSSGEITVRQDSQSASSIVRAIYPKVDIFPVDTRAFIDSHDQAQLLLSFCFLCTYSVRDCLEKYGLYYRYLDYGIGILIIVRDQNSDNCCYQPCRSSMSARQ